MSIRTFLARIVCLLGTTGLVLSASYAAAQSSSQIAACSKRMATGFQRFSIDTLELMSDCQVDSFKDDERTDCGADEDLYSDIEDSGDKLRREAHKCDLDALRAICPHGARDDDELKTLVLTAPGGATDRLADLDADLYSTEYPGCPRPTGEISRDAESCVDRIASVVEDGFDELQKCFYKCELSRVRKSGQEPCIEEGLLDPKIQECVDRVQDDLDDNLSNRCDAALLAEIGCPLDETTLNGLVETLGGRLFDEVERLSDGIFHSECSEGGGNSSEGGETDPAPATLFPSETPTQIDCGQTLDAAFFGADDELRLDGSLDCGPAGEGSIGIIVAASNVTLNGRTDWDLTGPSRSANRTGVGILIAPGAKNVTIENFRNIQRYAVGIGDSGDNDGLVIENLNVRRNRTAGVVTTSPEVLLDRVKADRNGIGFEVSGDGSTIQDCRALRGTPAPGLGIHLLGADTDGDGRVVRVNRCEVQENFVGVVIAEGPHLLEDNDVRLNQGHGVHVLSDGSKIESTSVKQNLGSGIVVDGDSNDITANSSDENAVDGFVIAGQFNDVNGNGAGSLTDLGNLRHGYLVSGPNNSIDTNEAEANLGHGFVVDAPTLLFKSNSAGDNSGIGFDVNSAGNTLDTNVAEDNGGAEFSIAPNNVDHPNTNRANGSTFSFGTGGGNFE